MKQYPGNISKFIRNPQFGVSKFVNYIKSWDISDDICVISYEGLHNDPHEEMRKVINFLGLEHDESALDKAIIDSNFKNMLKKELVGTMIPGHKYDYNDLNSRRMRTGKIGGYLDELSQDDIEFIRKRLIPLKDHFLYEYIKI